MAESICFFARLKDPSALHRVEFYAQDIRILRELGFDVRLVTRTRDLRAADLYFVWWWTWAFAPLSYAASRRRPAIVTGVFDHRRSDGTWEVFSRPKWQQWLMRYALRRADANVFISALERENIPKLFKVNAPHYSPCTVDTDAYKSAPVERQNTVLTIAWMNGANAERKCIPEVIKAAAIVHQTHPQVKFIIAGERGSYYPKLAQLVRDLNAHEYVQFPGIVSKEEKIKLLSTCALYLQPSRTEGFGLAILEAMSCGAPVVTSLVGTVPEVAADTVAYADGTSPQCIANEVVRLLASSAIRDDLSIRARARAVQMFPYERRRCDLQAIIERLLSK